MVKKFLFLPLCICLFTNPVFVSAQLLPSIGIGSLPNDNDAVCTIPTYTGSFDVSGYFEGDTVHDFTLYDMNGDSVNLASVLSDGKPTLLIGGSYTCPVFRGTIADINNMASIYSGLLNIYIVYVVEAHPVNDPSPYSGTVWVPSANYTEGVLYQQPTTYGERKALIDSMQQHYTINAPILIDGPCNNWWLNYGPAPNNAYLINTNGVVVAKHAWFNRAPDNMYCDIDSFLGTNSGNCITFGNNGAFTFTLDADSVAYGLPTQTLAVHGELTNISSTDNVVIDIIKRQINIPGGWQSAICADICYASTVDSTRLTLAPNQVQPFTYYFYTDGHPDQGDVRVLFRNVYNTANKMGQGFYGNTMTVGIDENVSSDDFFISPNPFHTTASLILPRTFTKGELKLYNILGKELYCAVVSDGNSVISNKGFAPGIYFVHLISEGKEWTAKMVVE
jgi:hypothetical protein